MLLHSKAKEAIRGLVTKMAGAGPPPGSYGGGGEDGMVELMIPGGKAGLIIGKGGETIKMLQVNRAIFCLFFSHPWCLYSLSF